MKKFAATALLGAVYCDGRTYSSNSRAVVSELKQHFEKTFGPGLVGMYNEHGEVHGKALAKASRRPQGPAEWVKVGGISFNGADAGSTLYGLAQGFQYNGLQVGGASTTSQSNLVESNCFYGMYGLMESVDQLMFDFNNIIDPAGEVKWFDMVFYNPISILNNVSVGYEMCDVYSQINKFSGLMSGDWALMGDYLATDMVYFMATDEGLNAVSNMTKILTCGAIDPKALKDKATAIAGQVTDIQGQISDVQGSVNDAKNGGIPKTESGWDNAVDDAEDTAKKAADGIADAGKAVGDLGASAEEIAKAMENCEPNFYKLGKQTGAIGSKIMKQKLDESKLP